MEIMYREWSVNYTSVIILLRTCSFMLPPPYGLIYLKRSKFINCVTRILLFPWTLYSICVCVCVCVCVFVCMREYKEPSISEQTNNTVSKLQCEIRPGCNEWGACVWENAVGLPYVRDLNNRLISWQHSSVHFKFLFRNITPSCLINTTVPKIVSLLLFHNIRIKMANLILNIVWLREQ
jgi:hypothetical protein